MCCCFVRTVEKNQTKNKKQIKSKRRIEKRPKNLLRKKSQQKESRRALSFFLRIFILARTKTEGLLSLFRALFLYIS